GIPTSRPCTAPASSSTGRRPTSSAPTSRRVSHRRTPSSSRSTVSRYSSRSVVVASALRPDRPLRRQGRRERVLQAGREKADRRLHVVVVAEPHGGVHVPRGRADRGGQGAAARTLQGRRVGAAADVPLHRDPVLLPEVQKERDEPPIADRQVV